MRIVLLLAGICAAALATPMHKAHYKVADKVFLEKQKDILMLFNYVNQPSYYKEFVTLAKEFKFEGHWDQWTKPEYAKEMYHHFMHDMLPQGEVFSVFYPEHMKQAVALFRTFYYAKDYQTFFKAAVWARQHVNEGMFVYALSVAIIHSKHTTGLVLPPIHEIFPHYFFADEVMYKVQQYKQHYWGTYEHEHEIKDATYKGHTIHANYTGWYMNVHPEQSMSYWMEDIGINSYYYYHHIFAPFWMPKEEFFYKSTHRGEYFYYHHQQLMARYFLERLSNGFGEVPHFEYEYPIETGFYPSLHYPNGMPFPTRPNHAHLYYHGVHGQQDYEMHGNYTYSYTYVMDYERRLRDALDKGFYYTPEGKMMSLFEKDGINTLGMLVESNVDSPNGRFYGDLMMFASHLLGYSYFPMDEHMIAPSALEHFETALRDPMFYQMYKRIMSYFFQYQDYQGPYEKKELLWDAVMIDDFEIDRLVTYFDYHYSDLSNAVTVNEKEFQEDSFEVRARQYRMNHKPFTYKIHVTSQKATEAFVKVFIGPKIDEYGREMNMADNWMHFMELERFHYTLQPGKNLIERHCHDNMYFAPDRPTWRDMYQAVMTAINGGEEFKYYHAAHCYGFPQRYMLPIGDIGGKTFQMYVMVMPYHTPSEMTPVGEFLVDTEYSMGYPFDRPIEFEHHFLVHNSIMKNVIIYHEHTDEMSMMH